MSRLGKQTIEIPKGTTVALSNGVLTVKGPKGELNREFKGNIEILINGNEITTKPKKDDDNFLQALWGTYASHIKNMIKGVNTPYIKKLLIEGVGFKWDAKGKDLTMSLGFSHPVSMKIPEGLEVASEKNTLSISGIDKEKVGQFAAEVRARKKPEPYKGKGIRYEGEIIRRKQGKKAA